MAGLVVNVRDDDFSDPWRPNQPVVLQHGFARSGSLYRGWVPYLGRRHRVLRPDLPGCIDSPDPGPGHVFTTDELVSTALAMLDERDIEKVHYVGEGVGGVIGAALAGSHPDRVSTVTLLNMPLRVSPDINANSSQGYATWAEAIEGLGTREWWMRSRAGGGDLTGDPEIDNSIADQLAKTPPHVLVSYSKWAPSWDLAELLPKVAVPCLFAWAEHSRVVARAEQQEVLSLAQDGQEFLARGRSTMMVPYIYPDEIAPAVAAFIDRSEAASRGQYA
jgi:pimeloyl-ACP methyl ester carboxylesterase